MPKGIKQLKDIHSNVMDKQAELQKKSTVYSTERVSKLEEAILNGEKPDNACFYHGDSNWRDSGVIFEYTDHELEELEKCANDCAYFVENYCKVLNSKGRTLIKLRDYQKRILGAMSGEKWDGKTETVVPEHPHVVMLLSRQSGKTVTTSCYIVWYVCFHYDRNAFVCANKGRTASEIMNKIKEILEGLPYFMKPGIVNLSQARMKFENGCSIKCAAASKSPATGDSIQLLYIDEAALIPAGVIEEYWGSVIPTMSSFTNSQIIVSSTPRTKGDRFYKIVEGACKGENDFFYQRVDWWEVPGHDEDWAKNQINLLGEELFNREFGLSFENEGARLISKHTSIFQNRIKQEFIHRDFYSVPDEISNKIIWSPDFNPTYMTYEELKNRRFLLVVDTALGVEAGSVEKKDSDYNVINIFEIEPLSPNKINLNRNNGPISIKDCVQYKQVGLYMDNVRDESACAEAAKFIAFQIFKTGYKDIDNTKVLIEINFNGNNWITKFKDHPSFYDNVIIKTQRGLLKPGVPVQKMKLQYGFRTTGGEHGKNYYCELGAKMMHHRLIIIRLFDLDVNKSSISQLNQFCKTAKGTYMGECCHDDISVTCLFVCIAQESRQFRLWLNEWIETTTMNKKKVAIIQNMLQIYVEKEALISDELHTSFYAAAGLSFGKLTHKQNGYGSVMSGESNDNNFYNYGSSANSGFGNMLSARRF